MDEIRSLHKNIEGYLRKHYLGKAISGGILFLGVSIALWVLFSLIEYAARLDSVPRGILFFGFLLIATALLASQFILPMLRRYGMFRDMDEKEASARIGRGVDGIEDRLTNALTIERISTDRLAMASLEQRAKELSAFDFGSAIDLRESLRWLRWAIIPILVALSVSLWDAQLLAEGSKRLIRYNETFIPPAPFAFDVADQDLTVLEGETYVFTAATVGSALPENAFIEMEGANFRMKQLAPDTFQYTFSAVRNDITFKLRGASVYSPSFTLRMLPQPKVIENNASIAFPDYLRRQPSSLMNRTKLIVPEGSSIQWSIKVKDVGEVGVVKDGKELPVIMRDDVISFESRFKTSDVLKLGLTSQAQVVDSSSIKIEVVPDAFPTIEARAILDSSELSFFFNGRIKDDYGFSRLRFVAEDDNGMLYEQDVALEPNLNEQSYTLAWLVDSILSDLDGSLNYYFEVWDNDGVNGAKSSRTQMWKYQPPTSEELRRENKEQFDRTKDALKEEEKELDQMQRDLERARKDLLEKKKLDWENKEDFQKLLERQEEMRRSLEQKAEQQKNQTQRNNRFNQYSEELMEKHRMVQEMFDKLFDESSKEKYEEYNKMLEELTKREMLEKLDEMELDNDKLEKELDRTLELFKQLEFEQGLEDRLKEIEDLKNKQEELQEKTDNRGEDAEELAKEQEELEKQLDSFNEGMEDLQEMNEALEQPNELPDLSEPSDEAQEGMQNAQDQLQKGNEKKAGEQQQKAKEKLEEMQNSLQDFQQQMQQDQQAENMENMRQLLENIVQLSKEQERVMESITPLKGSDPKYVEFAKRQKDIMDDTKVVEDSLLALSKRVPQLDKTINDEIVNVKFNMRKALQHLTDQPPNQEERYKAMASERQQQSMTSLNNLALLFDDIIQSMQQQMNSNMKGTGQCNKPGQSGGSKPSAAQMRKMQESLNKQLQKLKEALEKGENPNGKKPGQSEGMGLGGMSKELARMAAEQAAIRKQLREMSESMEDGGTGGGSKKLMEEMERMMEETEEDILFRQIDAQTLRRQQEILTKLLESEKAEREREKEEKRESASGREGYEIPDQVWEEFEKKREKELELYRTVPANLKPFYRNEVNRYFSNLQD